MKWTCEQVEDVMNYLRVNYGATEIFMFYLDNDQIGFYTDTNQTKVRHFSNIYKEMLDKQKEV